MNLCNDDLKKREEEKEHKQEEGSKPGKETLPDFKM
jgi:hypothetical protein